MQKHDEYPFQIVGILNLQVHLWTNRAYTIGRNGNYTCWMAKRSEVFKNKILKEQFLNSGIEPKSITAIFVGLKSKLATFSFQRTINNFADEPLLAILPGVALSELWQMMSLLEKVCCLLQA